MNDIQAQPAPLGRIGQYAVEESDFVYALIDGLALHAHSYRPQKLAGDLPAVVEVHGGAWNHHDRFAGQLYNRALASSGLYVLAIDFRQGPGFQHPLGSRDVTAAVRYLKTHASRLHIKPNQIGLIGSSSGGHLALLAGLMPNAKIHLGTPILSQESQAVNVDQLDASVDYIVALWPVSDPEYRYNYARQVKREELVQAHENYFGSIKVMQDASIQRLLKEDLVSEQLMLGVLIVQPGEDANIPRPMALALFEALQGANIKTDYLTYPGLSHAFAHRPSAATDDCIRSIRDYVNRRLAAS